MAPILSIHPLPDTEELLCGFYPIEQCSVRGLVRITHDPHRALPIQSLTITFKASTWTVFPARPDSFDTARRETVHLDLNFPLLPGPETFPSGTALIEIPFDIPIPDPEPPPAPTPGSGPSNHLLPPSIAIVGRALTDTYEGHVQFQLIAELIEQPSIFFPIRPSPRRVTLSLHPFRVYDPKLLPGLLHPDIRRWRSAPGATPVEYDIEVGSIVMGPSDPLRFAYRIAVAADAARKGVRLKKVTLTLREHHTVGEQRCHEGLIERKGVRVRGVAEILRWEQVELPPEMEAGSMELRELRPRGKTAAMLSHAGAWGGMDTISSAPPAPLPRPGNGGGGGDGLYVESEVTLRLPSVGGFSPTTPRMTTRPTLPPDNQPLPALVEIRHTLQVTIEFATGADKLVMESACVLAAVGRDDCMRILDDSPHLVPTLDYDKIVGGEVWVPEYRHRDEWMEEWPKLDAEALEAIKIAVEAELAEKREREQADARVAAELAGGGGGEEPSGESSGGLRASGNDNSTSGADADADANDVVREEQPGTTPAESSDETHADVEGDRRDERGSSPINEGTERNSPSSKAAAPEEIASATGGSGLTEDPDHALDEGRTADTPNASIGSEPPRATVHSIAIAAEIVSSGSLGEEQVAQTSVWVHPAREDKRLSSVSTTSRSSNSSRSSSGSISSSSTSEVESLEEMQSRGDAPGSLHEGGDDEGVDIVDGVKLEGSVGHGFGGQISATDKGKELELRIGEVPREGPPEYEP
ncbi:hypothetical protein HK097_006969 [Rhizophlyctis rosea]|uniref:Uncharacterized protein n=1 Tax=Rhizophlyctis rosea TaxID=64517 RepID=A0AAD5SCR8_9FUNG|nr:hypothetical protein HK097_006969 [Rhizophlyctis rosea]